MNLVSLVRATAPSMKDISAYLDGLSSAERVAQTRQLNGADQRRLFDAAAGFRTLRATDMVPASSPAMTGVRHEGRNSLPLFSLFAKVFYRPDDAAAAKSVTWGYNDGSPVVLTTVGPGYYVAVNHGEQEVLVDYLQQPPRPFPGSPPIIPNSARLSRFVFYQTQDVLRGVSAHVSIGRATRNGKDMNNWFVLCRAD